MDKETQRKAVKEILDGYQDLSRFCKSIDLMPDDEHEFAVEAKSQYIAEAIFTKIFNLINKGK